MLRRVGLLAVFLTFVLAVLSIGASPSYASSKVREVDFEAIKSPTLEVFMEVGATNAEVDAVEQAIRATPGIRRFGHLDTDDAYAEFKRIFVREPALIAAVEQADLPESFRLNLVAGRGEDVKRALRSLPGVEDVLGPSKRSRPLSKEELEDARSMCADGYYEVFMEVHATAEQIDAARAAIGADSKIDLLRVVDPATAYQEFREAHVRMAKESWITAADLPTSFRVGLGADPDPAVIERLRSLDGVSAVASPAPVCDDLVKRHS